MAALVAGLGLAAGGSTADADTGGSVVEIAVGEYHTCAVLDDGTARCWGRNRDGQIGNGESGFTTNSPSPAVVSGLAGATKIDAGYDHSCALPPRPPHSNVSTRSRT